MTEKARQDSLELRRADLMSPVAAELIARLNDELSTLYPEEGACHFRLDPHEVADGRGAFLVAYLDGQAVGCGAIRVLGPGEAEIKRMFVVPKFRRRGVAWAILQALETEAIQLGTRRLLLETGVRQPEAHTLYERAGFHLIPSYGEYVASRLSFCMAKDLEVINLAR
jgi:GNAT superfamily N-acetyltransferase